MSTETLAIVISAAGLLLGFVAAFAWMIKRSDEQFAGMRVELGAGEARLSARIDELGRRISGVEHELVDVKVAVARVEGPPRRLLTER